MSEPSEQVEAFARILAAIESRRPGWGFTLDQAIEYRDEKWRRHVYEAEQLLDEMGPWLARDKARAALSRAEEIIEKARTVLAWGPDHDGSDPLRVQGDYMWRAQLADEALYVLAEYDKQKEADRG